MNAEIKSRLLKVIPEVLSAMERDAEQIDGEWGGCARAEDLVADGDMHDCYYELKKVLDELKRINNAG